jgi:hypothetical protein
MPEYELNEYKRLHFAGQCPMMRRGNSITANVSNTLGITDIFFSHLFKVEKDET